MLRSRSSGALTLKHVSLSLSLFLSLSLSLSLLPLRGNAVVKTLDLSCNPIFDMVEDKRGDPIMEPFMVRKVRCLDVALRWVNRHSFGEDGMEGYEFADGVYGEGWYPSDEVYPATFV